MAQNELMHFGVKGMKWGVRRASLVSTQKRKNPIGTMDGDGWSPKFKPPAGAKYVTVRQANKNAKAAMDTARKESIANDKARSKAGERVTYRQASKNAKAAMDTARKESIAKDKEANRDAREARKTAKAQAKVDKLQSKRDKYKKLMESEIDSFKGYENGIYDKKGNMMLSPKDVEDCKRGLADTMNKKLSAMDAQINRAKRAIGS